MPECIPGMGARRRVVLVHLEDFNGSGDTSGQRCENVLMPTIGKILLNNATTNSSMLFS